MTDYAKLIERLNKCYTLEALLDLKQEIPQAIAALVKERDLVKARMSHEADRAAALDVRVDDLEAELARLKDVGMEPVGYYINTSPDGQPPAYEKVVDECKNDPDVFGLFTAAQVAAKLAQVEKDAERYRWLRHGDNDEKCIRFSVNSTLSADEAWLLRNEELDAAIDAAMAEEKKEQP